MSSNQEEALPHSTSHISLHSNYSSTTSIHDGKGVPHLKNYHKQSLQERCRLNQINSRIAEHIAANDTMINLQKKLRETTTITIPLKKKLSTEAPLIGKSGRLLLINKTETLGMLLEPSERSCCKNNYVRNENDPLQYEILSPMGEELISIHGLDNESLTRNRVIITISSLSSRIGTVQYDYPGAVGDALSKATTMAGREDSYLVPTSVFNDNGEMLYIFRRDEDSIAYTEILSADGTAVTIAEVLIGNKNIGRTGAPDTFTLNFIETSGTEEKLLVIGVAITLFNQWLTRQKPTNTCCGCTII